jgi:hypothetical protein
MRSMTETHLSSPKLCTKCGYYKSVEEFYVRKVGPNSTRVGETFIDPICKVCSREYSNAQRAKDVERSRTLQKLNCDAILLRNRQFAWDYLAAHPCVDCGERDVIVLEFDHVRGEKEFAIAVGICKKYSLERLAGEMAKCDVRCANCHKRITAARADWYANVLSAGDANASELEKFEPIIFPEGIMDGNPRL